MRFTHVTVEAESTTKETTAPWPREVPDQLAGVAEFFCWLESEGEFPAPEIFESVG